MRGMVIYGATNFNTPVDELVTRRYRLPSCSTIRACGPLNLSTARGEASLIDRSRDQHSSFATCELSSDQLFIELVMLAYHEL